MIELEEQKKDWKLFFFPAMIVLTGFVIYGRVENMLNSSDGSLVFWPDFMLYFFLVFMIFLVYGLGYIIYYRFLMKGTESKNVKLLFAAILTLVAAFIIYNICEEFLGVVGSYLDEPFPALVIPNLMPWFVSWGSYSGGITLSWYHLFIFGFFFPSICYGYMIMDYLHFRDGWRTARLLIMFLGTCILGLMWQDFYYFATHPTEYLIPGERYGVYFNQWLGIIPTIYIFANALGLGLIYLAVTVRGGLKYWEIYKFLIFIGVILVVSVSIHTFKIPFII